MYFIVKEADITADMILASTSKTVEALPRLVAPGFLTSTKYVIIEMAQYDKIPRSLLELRPYGAEELVRLLDSGELGLNRVENG